MQFIFTIAICILRSLVESQSYLGQNPQYNQRYNDQTTGIGRTVYNDVKAKNISPYLNYTSSISNINPSQNVQFRSNIQEDKLNGTERDSYLPAISRNDNLPQQKIPNGQQTIRNDDRIYFIYPSEKLTPPPFAGNPSPNHYSTQQKNAVFTPPKSEPESFDGSQENMEAGPNTVNNIITNAVSNFGLRLMKIASQLEPGNLIVSPLSIATVLALLQQGATGEAQAQITESLNMSPDVSRTIFSTVAANITKRKSRNILSIANNIFVSNAFDLNNNFKSLAIRSFWSEVSATNFARSTLAIDSINTWVATKTNNKITNLLGPGAVSQATQLILVNAVYFKGLWETKFKPERTQSDTFHLNNGDKKLVPFMHTRHAFKVGYDPNTQALVTILPFEGHQYSLILILPKKTDTIANVWSFLTTEQLLQYQKFDKIEITVDLPKFTLKTDTDLNPVLRNMGITNIFGSRSELTGIGLFHNTPPQISNAVHSGFLAIDEQGVTAAAATSLVAIALSYDDSSISFKADRPFIAVLWDNQLSIPIFISKIEDPS